jgi:hypothetical protein
VTTSRLVVSTLLSMFMASAWVPATQIPLTQPEAPADQPAAPTQPRVQADDAATAGPPEVWLRGPFGRVPGGSVDDPATAVPLGHPLDTFVRRAPLLLELDAPVPIGGLTVVARPVDGADSEEVLSSGALVFEGPNQPGQSLLVVSVAGPVEETERYAWLLEVPDREPPPDGLYDIPAPEVIVASGAGAVIGQTGSGCYAYLCVDSGGLPPGRTLEPLAAGVGELLSLRLGDGSAILAWEGSLSPLGRTRGRTREAFAALTDSAEEVVSLAGLEPPASGEWLLRLKIVFDRERGWLWTAYRLTVD